MRWKSFDGLEIEGVLTRPPEWVARPPYELLLLHGGPHHRATSGGGFDVQIFATCGFAVFQPNFRGSTGYGLKFLDADGDDFGGGDMCDIFTGIDQLVQQGVVDSKRQSIYGVSYGGLLTSWLVGQTQQFRAAVAQNAVTDLNTMWHLSDLQSWTDWDMNGRPWEVPARLREHSPLTHAHPARDERPALSRGDGRHVPPCAENGCPSQKAIEARTSVRYLKHRDASILNDTPCMFRDWRQRYILSERQVPIGRAIVCSRQRLKRTPSPNHATAPLQVL